MARWVDFPDWGDGIARLLHKTLAEEFTNTEENKEIWRGIGMPLGGIRWDQASALLWPALTRDAAQAGKLDALIIEVGERKPALGARLEPVRVAENASVGWYRPLHRREALLLGPGSRRAMVDRARLRTHLASMLRELDPYSVLSITGEPGTGKSYSHHLIRYVADDRESEFVAVNIDEDWYDDVDAVEFMRRLAKRLDLNPEFDVDLHTEPSRIARELVDVFVGRFAKLPRKLRWIFVDGLDRPQVQPSVHLVVARLAKEVALEQLRDTRLVMTGHPGDFAPDVLDVLLAESISRIDEDHLEAFFSELALAVRRELSEDELKTMVAQVLTKAQLSDLRALSRAVSEVAHEHFASGGAA